MSPQKRQFLRDFISSYEITTAADLQEALKDLLGDALKDILESEMN